MVSADLFALLRRSRNCRLAAQLLAPDCARTVANTRPRARRSHAAWAQGAVVGVMVSATRTSVVVPDRVAFLEEGGPAFA